MGEHEEDIAGVGAGARPASYTLAGRDEADVEAGAEPPDSRIASTMPLSAGGLKPETIEPSPRLSSVTPLDFTPLTVPNWPPT